MIRVSLVALAATIVLAGCAPHADVNVDATAPGLQQGLTTTTLSPVADTHVRRGTPYYAYGTEGLLRVGTTDRRKSLIAFSPAAITSALAGQRVVSAHLELTLGSAVASFPIGQALVAHPLSKPFTEARATYSCADDTAPTNWANNCTTANLWSLETAPFPWRATGIPLAVTTGTTGTLRFNVTADIVDIKAGISAHNGWVVLRTLDTQGGEANFRSREATSPPRLVIVTEPEAVCGNGVREGTEACDDGNTTNADGCTACVIDRCGDGLPNNAGTEQCDDGNTVDGDGCTACATDFCGDALVNNAGAEQCDDGNAIDDDGCTTCVVDRCGDGLVNNAGAEQCDDGNTADGDGCTACATDFCGDALVNNAGAEQCDDGNAVDGDGCTACVVDRCGDGVMNNGGIEQCDDGNTVDGDGCSSCVTEFCGDALVNASVEQCDDGNDRSGDGCTECMVDLFVDGLVTEAVAEGETAVVAGTFTYVGKATGSLAVVDSSGESTERHEVFGEINQLTPDGIGGYIFRGAELPDGSLASLAHMDINGTVHRLPAPSWSAGIFVKNGILYSIGSQSFAVNLESRTLTSWTLPVAARAGTVVGDNLYISGPFTSVLGQPRNGLAAFDLASASLLSWAPAAGRTLWKIQSSATTDLIASSGDAIEAISISSGTRRTIASGRYNIVDFAVFNDKITIVDGFYGPSITSYDFTGRILPSPDGYFEKPPQGLIRRGVARVMRWGSDLVIAGDFFYRSGQQTRQQVIVFDSSGAIKDFQVTCSRVVDIADAGNGHLLVSAQSFGGTYAGGLFAVELSSGDYWSLSGFPGTFSAIHARGGMVSGISGDYAMFDIPVRGTSATRRSYPLGSPPRSAVHLGDSIAYQDGGIRIISESGVTSSLPTSIPNASFMSGNSQYIVATEYSGNTISISSTNGDTTTLNFAYSRGTDVTALRGSELIAFGSVFGPEGPTSGVFAADLETGELLWTNDQPPMTVANAGVVGDHVWAGGDEVVHFFDENGVRTSRTVDGVYSIGAYVEGSAVALAGGSSVRLLRK